MKNHTTYTATYMYAEYYIRQLLTARP